MRIFKTIVIAAVATFAALMLVLVLYHAYGTGSDEDTLVSKVDKNLVAASLGDFEVYEYEVEEYIINLRTNYSLTDESTWKSYLSMYGYTPESFREIVINNVFMYEHILDAAAEAQGITVDESEVEAAVAKMRAQVDSDEEWQSMLASAGYTEETYKDRIRLSMKDEALMEKVAPLGEMTDEKVLETAESYKSYYDGMKRSSHILVSTDDEALAKEIKEKLDAGTITWEEAVAQYTKDEGGKDDNGDVGWDSLNSFVSEYTTALDELEKGEISDPVLSTYGYHIIMCTDVWEAPEELTSLDQLPAELRTQFENYVESYVLSDEQEHEYSEWMENFRESLSDFKINDMPEGLTYDFEEDEEEEDEDDHDHDHEDETATDSSLK